MLHFTPTQTQGFDRMRFTSKWVVNNFGKANSETRQWCCWPLERTSETKSLMVAGLASNKRSVLIDDRDINSWRFFNLQISGLLEYSYCDSLTSSTFACERIESSREYRVCWKDLLSRGIFVVEGRQISRIESLCVIVG
jgi:hypothetical protein